MDSRNYTKDFVLEFIELYRSHPCLWKIKSKDYSNKIMRNKAYEQLILKLREVDPDATKATVQKKVDSMKGNYRKELKKVTASKKSGASVDDVYSPHLWYFQNFSFLEDQEVPRNSKSNLQMTDELVQENLEEEDSVPESSDDYLLSPSTGSTVAEETSHERPQSNNSTYNNSNTNETSTSRRSISSTEYETTPKPKKAKAKADIVLDKVITALDSSREDKFDIVGKHYANKLRGLPKEMAVLAEKFISDILFEAEMGNLTRSSKLHIYNSVDVLPTQDVSHLPHTQTSATVLPPERFSALTFCNQFTEL